MARLQLPTYIVANCACDAASGAGSAVPVPRPAAAANTFRSVEAAWQAALAAGEERIAICIREGDYEYPSVDPRAGADIDGDLDSEGEFELEHEAGLKLDVGGRELTIYGEGKAKLVARKSKSFDNHKIAITGDKAKVTVRDLSLVGILEFSGDECMWTVERCEIDAQHTGLLERSECEEFVGALNFKTWDGSRLLVQCCRIHNQQPAPANAGRERRVELEARHSDAGVFIEGMGSKVHVEFCEVSGFQIGVLFGNPDVRGHVEGSELEISGCQIRDCIESVVVAGIVSGSVAGNTFWDCDHGVRNEDHDSSFQHSDNEVFSAEDEPPQPLLVGPHCSRDREPAFVESANDASRAQRALLEACLAVADTGGEPTCCPAPDVRLSVVPGQRPPSPAGDIDGSEGTGSKRRRVDNDAGSVVVPAHSFVLQLHSAWFRRQFASGAREAVEVGGYSVETVRAFLRYCYTGEVDVEVVPSKECEALGELKEAALGFGVPRLVTRVVRKMEEESRTPPRSGFGCC